MISGVAVLPDIHGVLLALDRVLAEPAVQQAEIIAVTGDHTWGPQPTSQVRVAEASLETIELSVDSGMSEATPLPAQITKTSTERNAAKDNSFQHTALRNSHCLCVPLLLQLESEFRANARNLHRKERS